MHSNDCTTTITQDIVGRAYLVAFGFHAQYTVVLHGTPLSIASFIGSQDPSSLVTIEKGDEEPYIYTIGCRVKNVPTIPNALNSRSICGTSKKLVEKRANA